jgi:hypothetical protein
METGNSHIAAGWFADPADPARIRYWDGSSWTEHTALATAEPAEAVPPDAHYGPFGLMVD